MNICFISFKMASVIPDRQLLLIIIFIVFITVDHWLYIIHKLLNWIFFVRIIYQQLCWLMHWVWWIHFKSSGIIWWIILEIVIFFVVNYRSIRCYWTILLNNFIICTIWKCLEGLVLEHFTYFFFAIIVFLAFAFDTYNCLSKRSILRFRSPLALPFSRLHDEHLLFTFSLWTIIIK